MNSPESTGNEPSPYTDLFDKFKVLVTQHGIMNHGPLDRSLPAGDDGTITPRGDRAVGYDLDIPSDSLPDSLLQLGISKISVGTFSATVIDGSVWGERVWVSAEETIGLITYYAFERKFETGDVRLTKTVDPLHDTESQRVNYDGIDADEITKRVFEGDLELLSAEGLEGDYARAVHLTLSGPADGSMDDVEALYYILSNLESK